MLFILQSITLHYTTSVWRNSMGFDAPDDGMDYVPKHVV
jgi:hypothetical protein